MKRHFESIKAQFQHRVYSYAYYSLRVAADAEDITQEVFIRLWQNWPHLNPLQAKSWLMRVTHNLIIDHVRSQKNRTYGSNDDKDEDDSPEVVQHQDELDQPTLRLIVEQSIAQLDDPYRTTMILREVQGMSYQNIAEILSVSINQIKTDLFRAKYKLRAIVKLHPLYSTDLLQEEPTT